MTSRLSFGIKTTPAHNTYAEILASPADGIGRLAEACVILRRMWTEPVFDFSGRYYRLAAVRCSGPARRS